MSSCQPQRDAGWLGRGPAETTSLFCSSKTSSPSETVDTIVSEHYDGRDPNAARLMERYYYGYN
jgi:hypothetical protein